jgi:hypothetical protein
MSFTRFRDEPDRIKKQLQQSTDVGRYVLNVPGPGDKPLYMEDPYIRAQMWGGNIMTNTVDIETELRGLSRRLNKDTRENNYLSGDASVATRTNELIVCPTRGGSAVEQSRATHPAWILRDLEQDSWKMLHFDPQENVFMPFNNNLSTRILEKDHFVPSVKSNGGNGGNGGNGNSRNGSSTALRDDTYFAVHPSNRNPELEGMVGDRRTTERGLGVNGFGTACSGDNCNVASVGDFRQFSGEALFS